MERNIEKHIKEGRALIRQFQQYDLAWSELLRLRDSGTGLKLVSNSFCVGVAIGARMMKNELKKKALQK